NSMRDRFLTAARRGEDRRSWTRDTRIPPSNREHSVEEGRGATSRSHASTLGQEPEQAAAAPDGGAWRTIDARPLVPHRYGLRPREASRNAGSIGSGLNRGGDEHRRYPWHGSPRIGRLVASRQTHPPISCRSQVQMVKEVSPGEPRTTSSSRGSVP